MGKSSSSRPEPGNATGQVEGKEAKKYERPLLREVGSLSELTRLLPVGPNADATLQAS
ncbi:MAG: lasso RiPP family leader peptide-containing protein [bacterium]